MGFKDPAKVISPKHRWEMGTVLCSTGQGGWSVAEGRWDKQPALGIRWNGDDDSGSPGNPQSHGNPTWFIVPEELQEAVRGVAYRLNEAVSSVTFTRESPSDFDEGVFRIAMTVEGKARAFVDNNAFTFEVPNLPNRFFRHEPELRVAPRDEKSPWRGRFKDGRWTAIVQTNGIAEGQNPTSMDVVRDALVASVAQSLEAFMPKEPPPPAISHHRL